MIPQLTIIDGPEAGKTFALKQGKQIIGRDTNSDISINH